MPAILGSYDGVTDALRNYSLKEEVINRTMPPYGSPPLVSQRLILFKNGQIVNKLITFILIFFVTNLYSQRFITKEAEISFFSEAPIEDISAKNNKVSAVYDAETKQLVFQLNISDFIFPKPLMQEHFNENYLESDKFPKASFSGNIGKLNKVSIATGTLKIHGESNEVDVKGSLVKSDDSVMIDATFTIQLKDYKIKIPKIVMYNIAEEIEVTVKAKLKEI